MVVLVHEFGHFIIAVLTGIRVKTFSIGFGKRLFGFRRGETDYCFSLVPLGGYCRFYGEETFKNALDKDMDSIPVYRGEFYAAAPWKRTLVSLAGPCANIVFAVLIFTLIAWIGYQYQYSEPRIILLSDFMDGVWPADEAGLQSGDRIAEVDGEAIESFEDLRRRLILRPGESIPLSVERGGQPQRVSITPRLDKENGIAVIGVLNWTDPVISQVQPGSAADKAGFQPGDRISAVNGVPVYHAAGFYKSIEAARSPLAVDFIREGRQLSTLLSPAGESPPGLDFVRLTGRSQQRNFFASLSQGAAETWNVLRVTVKGIRMMFMGIRLRNAVSGPIRLITFTGETVMSGFQFGFGPGMLKTFELMAFISVSLAFLNLLPIPVLDGGQIVLFVVEIIRRRSLTPHVIYRYQFIGFIIVVIMAIAAAMGDLLYFRAQ
ncbi:MAG: RIP metalloprotease RseP [Spirochaeta sp. LUC14_002_19_P3]|nr:MAG: RIP metalloprotease RseP [Spirochaeta sp. LUC14_002_19_P3]